jgi:hypothetical protein
MRTSRFRALCLLSVAAFSLAGPAWADDQQQSQPTPQNQDQGPNGILVLGQIPQVIVGLQPEDELDENDIAAYGANTLGEVIGEVSDEIDPLRQGTVVLINGKLANGMGDVSDLPAEAASRIQVLPPAVAARLGQSSTRRVINVVIKPDLAQITANGEAGWSTRGDAFRGQAELNLLKLQNNNRRSLVLRAQRIDPLLESDRGIVTATSGSGFATAGNVVGIAGGEIDPALSALAGHVVSQVGIPASTTTPTLAQFAANANAINTTSTSPFRTLVSGVDRYTANGNITQILGPNTRLVLTAEFNHSQSHSLNGLPEVSLTVPAGSPYSPFGRAALVHYLGPDPLEGTYRNTSINVAGTLNTTVAKFDVTAQATYIHSSTRGVTDIDYDLATLQSGINAGTVNPFSGITATQLGALRESVSRSTTDTGQAQVTANGTLFPVPAGDVGITASVLGRFDQVSSSTTGAAVFANDFSRAEVTANGDLQIPLTKPESAIGELTADVNGAISHVRDAGTVYAFGGNLSWRPSRTVNLNVNYADREIPTSPSQLNDPVVVTENYRVFDFIRDETVLVRLLTGGNPALLKQDRRTLSIEGTLRPWATYDFTINAGYFIDRGRNSVTSLPPPSAEVQAAYPDRYLRDAGGRLILVDARPVSFLREDSEQFRWGFSYRHTFGRSEVIGEDTNAPIDPSKGRGVRVNLSANHVWVLSSTRQARATLPVVDLLNGGVVGYGGGTIRHAVNWNAGLVTRGVGLQLSGQWRGPSFVTTGTAAAPDRLDFDSRMVVNARLFANMGPLLPDQTWAKGLRFSLQVANMFDSKQQVRDSAGLTPLSYQPFLLDPLGRSFTIGIRKVF